MSTAKNSLKRDRPVSPPVPAGPLALRLQWSDGTITWHAGTNGPTEDMLDPSADESGATNYMRPVDRYSKKEIHWLLKLAEELAKSKDPGLLKKVGGGKLIFESLPEGYRLFEQVQMPGRDGGKARTDTYLYGHPKGPRKRFRSPGDFLPHIIWLATDLTKNAANCPCRACKGMANEPTPLGTSERADSPRPAKPAAGTAAVKAAAPPRPKTVASTAPASPAPAPAKKAVAPVPPRRSGSASASSAAPTPRLATAPLPSQPAAPAAVPTVDTPAFRPSEPVISAAILLQSQTYQERHRDLQPPDLFIYRLGEQVWVQTGPHWSLGVVIAMPTAPSHSEGYTIQLLNSPFTCERIPPLTKMSPEALRPWVAWSTPPITSPHLSSTDIEYENLPWKNARTEHSLEVDASIVKARQVDSSYTLVDRLGGSSNYAGIYHGAEKFWIGDAVRLKASALAELGVVTGSEILLVMGIQDGAPGTVYGTRTKETGVFISGDIYRLTVSVHPVTNPMPLPVMVSTDIMVRSRITVSNPSEPHVMYTPVATSVHVRLDDVKGRWYPTSSLYRIMNGQAAFKAMVQEKRWEESGGKMNEMGNAGHANSRGWIRFEHRHQTFTKSIPANIIFPPLRALPPAPPPQPTPQPSQQSSAEQPAGGLAHDMRAVDLTADDENAGMEFLTDDPQDEVEEDELLRKMREDANSFLADEGDAFYGGL